MTDRDPLTGAFELLKARSLERPIPNLELEGRLMTYQENASRWRFSRCAAVLTVVLLCITAGGVAEATTGLFSNMIRTVYADFGNGWQQLDEQEYTVNADGSVTATFDLSEEETAKTVTLKVVDEDPPVD